MRLALLIALFAAACGDDAPATDAGNDDAPPIDGDLVVEPPRAPASPAPVARPVLTPCPPGWTATPSGEGFDVCEPLPRGEPTCGDDERLALGSAGCVHIGRACPDEAFGDDEADLYVDDDAEAAGDGSRARPFATLDDAFSASSEGDTIAIAKGRYEGPFLAPTTLTLRGACARDTVLTTTAGETFPVLRTAGATLTVEDLSVRDAASAAFAAQGGSLTLRGVIVTDSAPPAVTTLEGATLTVTDVSIRDMREGGNRAPGAIAVAESDADIRDFEASSVSITAIHTFGRAAHVVVRDSLFRDIRAFGGEGIGVAVSATFDSVVEMERVAIVRPTALGLATLAGTLRAEDMVIRDVRAITRSSFLEVSVGTAEIARAWFDGAVRGGVLGKDGGSLTMEDCLVQHVADDGSGTNDYIPAIGVLGAAIALRRVAVVDVSDVGVVSRDSEDVALEDVLVRRSGADGIDLGGGDVSATRVEIEDAQNIGLACPADTVVHVTDLVVHVSDAITESAFGLSVERGATAVIERAEIRNAVGIGCLFSGRGAMRDVVVEDTRALPGGHFGRGIEIGPGATLELERARLTRPREVGIRVNASTATITDLAVEDTQPQADTGLGGTGIRVDHGASARLDRAVFRGNHFAGVEVYAEAEDDPRASLEGRDVRVTATRQPGCVDCLEREYSAGLIALGGAHVAIERFELDDNGACGVQLVKQPVVELSRGRVRDHAVGICADDTEIELASVERDVDYSRNDTALSTSSLPVPSLALDEIPE